MASERCISVLDHCEVKPPSLAFYIYSTLLTQKYSYSNVIVQRSLLGLIEVRS